MDDPLTGDVGQDLVDPHVMTKFGNFRQSQPAGSSTSCSLRVNDDVARRETWHANAGLIDYPLGR